jgi:hypothetical protein
MITPPWICMALSLLCRKRRGIRLSYRVRPALHPESKKENHHRDRLRWVFEDFRRYPACPCELFAYEMLPPNGAIHSASVEILFGPVVLPQTLD